MGLEYLEKNNADLSTIQQEATVYMIEKLSEIAKVVSEIL